ncbi:MAG TPA: phosphotransferase, partial [Acidimicrobiales bacterium]|nr:phosphotransferase [Acidimicrobiales bacterium]
TDNALYRLGADMVVRLPLRPSSIEPADKEHRWLPDLAPHLPLAIPVPLARGEPMGWYPWPWSVYPWLDGEDATTARLDLRQAACDLARFITALHSLDRKIRPWRLRLEQAAHEVDVAVDLVVVHPPRHGTHIPSGRISAVHRIDRRSMCVRGL